MTSRALGLLRAGALVALLSPLALAPTASAADSPAPPQVSPTTTAGDGPQLASGQYAMTLPADETERFVRVSKGADEAVSVGTYSTDPGGDGVVNIEMRLEDGTSCTSDSARASSYGDPWISTFVALDPAAEQVAPTADCKGATELYVALSRQSGGSPLPLQMQVQVRPKMTGDLGAEATGKDIEQVSVAARSGTKVDGGDTPGTATVLRPGDGLTTTVSARKPVFYRVHVGWSQRLAVSAQIPPNGDKFTPKTSLTGTVALRSPGGSDAAVTSSSTYLSTTGGGTSSPASAVTAPVRAGNLGSAEAKVRAAGVAGWYVIALYVAPGSSTDTAQGDTSVPVNLTTRLVGDPTAGPTFVSASGQNLAAPAAGAISGTGQQESGMSLGIKLGGSALIVLICAAALTWLLRRRT